MVYTDEQKAFIDDHRWGVLATERCDGSPQQAMVGYTQDGDDRIVISTPQTTAKWKNAARRSKVSFTVPDGRVHVVVYGTVETITSDPERAELTADLLAVVRGPERPDPSSIVGWMNEERRGILRLTPEKVMMHH
jgi:PPOX class probable F420-dependent enzyme